MSDVQIKETIRQGFAQRQAAREAARLERRGAETAAAISAAEVENRMTTAEGLDFLMRGGEREDA